MRTIKFRGKRTDTGEWVYGDLKHDKGISITGLYDRVMIAGYEVDEETVGQFTGLLDKNDKMVYEGDIVKRETKRTDYYPEQYMPRIKEHPETKRWIEYETNVISLNPEIRFGLEFITKMPKLKEVKDDIYLSSFNYEIMGNIHDNPNLLKGEYL